jgi:hypothetical protein
MVNFRNITDKAKEAVEKRGGTESLKQDASEIKDIFKGEGTLKDKARAAASAVKDPGSRGEAAGPATRSKPHGDPAADKVTPEPVAVTEDRPKPAGATRDAARKAETKTEEQRAK